MPQWTQPKQKWVNLLKKAEKWMLLAKKMKEAAEK
jgi:hypothetical protein